MISPLIQETIQNTVAAAISSLKTTCVDPILEANTELRGMIENQHITISNQNKLIDDQNKQISDQKNIIMDQKELIESKTEQMDELVTAVDALKIRLNELEQYGRRNSLRFVNMKLPEPTSDDRDDRGYVVGLFVLSLQMLFCLALILHDDMYTEIEIIQNLSPKIDANVNVL